MTLETARTPRDPPVLRRGRPDPVPDYREGDAPPAIAERDPDAEYEGTRIPGKHLTA